MRRAPWAPRLTLRQRLAAWIDQALARAPRQVCQCTTRAPWTIIDANGPGVWCGQCQKPL